MGGSEATSSKTASKAAEKTVEKENSTRAHFVETDTYVGSVEAVKEKMWVYDSVKQKMVYR